MADQSQQWLEGTHTFRPRSLNYGLHPDGQRLVVRKGAGEDTDVDLTHPILFENFFDYLKEQVPATR